jgi:translation initiation factor 1
MEVILNLEPNSDPFAQNNADTVVHLRCQKRNGRKSITTIQGLVEHMDADKLKKFLSILQKQLSTGGAIVNDKEYGQIIQVNGDHRTRIRTLLVQEELVPNEQIKLHGY